MPRELTQDEKDRGYDRVDEETDQPLRKGWMSRAEFRAWAAKNRERWRAVFFAKDPPRIEGTWVFDKWHGWLRKREDRKR
jgi:hypothetical protein